MNEIIHGFVLIRNRLDIYQVPGTHISGKYGLLLETVFLSPKPKYELVN